MPPKLPQCEICAFENPQPTATAVIIHNGRLLVSVRATAPFKGAIDFIGGYMKKNETPEQALAREMREELGVTPTALTPLGTFPGHASYKTHHYPIISFAYLAELPKKKMKRDPYEIAGLKWIDLRAAKLKHIAFDSNRAIAAYIKKQLAPLPTKDVAALVRQLDSTARFNEQNLYRAALTGHVETARRNGRLVGMGWLFVRQTALRKQAVIEDMIVDARERGKGHGARILKKLIAWARTAGVETIELTTNPARTAANRLYQKAGFVLHPTNHYLLHLHKNR